MIHLTGHSLVFEDLQAERNRDVSFETPKHKRTYADMNDDQSAPQQLKQMKTTQVPNNELSTTCICYLSHDRSKTTLDGSRQCDKGETKERDPK